MIAPDRHTIAGVLLAGGQSSRMGGGDKCLSDLGGHTMLAHVVARLAPQVSALALNANGPAERFAAFGLPVVPDTIEGFAGPLAGVLSGMRWATAAIPHATHIVTVSTDAPFVPTDLVARFVEGLAGGGAIAMARSLGELHPVIALWPVALADDLEEALKAGVRKVLRWTDRHGTIAVDFEPLAMAGRSIDPFFNANTPEELEEARALFAGCRS